MNQDENQELTKEEVKDLKSKQAGKDVVDTAGRAAASYLAPGVGGKVYDAVSKTKLGQQAIDNASNLLNQNPAVKNMLAKSQPAISSAKPAADMALGSKTGTKSNISNLGSGLEEQNDSSANQDSFDSIIKTDPNNKFFFPKTHLIPIIGIIAAMFIFLMGAFIVMYRVEQFMKPVEYLKSIIKGDSDKQQDLYNDLSGCIIGESCDKYNFYTYVNDKYNEYYEKYGIELDRALLIATLTYTDPEMSEKQSTDEDETEEMPSNLRNYKKTKKKVNLLIDLMTKKADEECYVVDENGIYEAISCSETEKYINNGQQVVIDPFYILDMEKYKELLPEKFIIKYYLDNIKTEDNQKRALKIRDEIYDAAEEYREYLLKEDNNTNFYNDQSLEIKVNVTDCDGNLTLEQVTLSEYLQGVVYMNSNNENDDYLKFIAIAAKNNLYNINNATVDNMPLNLRVKNCKQHQLYCNVEEGCYYSNGTGNETDTLYSGKGNNKEYAKKPADAQILNSINRAVDETIDEFITDNNSIVAINLNNINKDEIISKLYNNSYQTVLSDMYGGTTGQVNLYTKSYPLDLKNNEVTSHYGWRLHPVDKVCRYHDGTDIGGVTGDNIYSIADGVVVLNEFHSGYGNYTIIGHGNYNSITQYYDYYSLYAHQNRLSTLVSVGSNVKVGQLIGNVGSTGRSTGSHLHIEIFTMISGNIRDGIKTRTDPITYFKNVDLTGLVAGPMYNSLDACKAANP